MFHDIGQSSTADINKLHIEQILIYRLLLQELEEISWKIFLGEFNVEISKVLIG